MQAFDSTRHNHLLPIRSLLQSWWDNRPSDVIGLALYGSRAKYCAEQYSDWDIVIFTSSEKPDEDAICRDLPRDYADAPIHALCESIEYVKSEAKYGGNLMSAIVEQAFHCLARLYLLRRILLNTPVFRMRNHYLVQLWTHYYFFLLKLMFVFERKSLSTTRLLLVRRMQQNT